MCVPGYGALITNCDLDVGRVKGLSTNTAGGRTSWLHVSAASAPPRTPRSASPVRPKHPADADPQAVANRLARLTLSAAYRGSVACDSQYVLQGSRTGGSPVLARPTVG